MMSGSIDEDLKKKKKNFRIISLQSWTLKICNHDISESITARSFRPDQLIEDDE